MTFSTAEVDVDAAKTVVDRSSKRKEGLNVHRGRLFLFAERASKKRKFVVLKDVDVAKGDALPPESNADVWQPMQNACVQGQSLAATVAKPSPPVY